MRAFGMSEARLAFRSQASGISVERLGRDIRSTGRRDGRAHLCVGHSIPWRCDQLEGLVGPQRAAILRLLDTGATCGDLANALYMAPGGVTHHLRLLEAAGLVIRERVGRNVIVERTARGRAVLALYRRVTPDRPPDVGPR
jgi:DNA-binding transcriptional ArsR family regulator